MTRYHKGRSAPMSSQLFLILLLVWAIVGGISPSAIATETADLTLIVKLVSGLTPAEQSAIIERHGGTEKSSIPSLRMHVITVSAPDPLLILQDLQGDPQVERVELDVARKAEAVPGDPEYGVQWAFTTIGWESVYETVAPAGSATVALLDTGIDASHPDLAGNVVPGRSMIDGSDGLTDPAGHGTWLGGIVGAVTDNEAGIAGIAFKGVRIMPVTVLDPNGNGKDSDIISGIVWAADHGADVILMGFSNPYFSQNLQDAVDYAWTKGAVLVAATGNDGVGSPTFPAGNRGVIGVSATDRDDSLAAGSNYGQDVFMAAPGTSIYTTSPDDAYTYISGTSASSAFVAGVAAFMKAVDPTLTNGVIVGRLARSADPAGAPGAIDNEVKFGNGRLNMVQALADKGSEPIQPAGASPVGSGGPFIGAYKAAASGASDGEGTAAVDTTSVLAGSSGNGLTFTFTAPAGRNFPSGSQVAISVPAGWSAPQKSSAGSAGYVTVTSGSCTPGSSSVSGMTITVNMACLAKTSFSVSYANASAPATVGNYTFTTKTRSGNSGSLVAIGTSPTVLANAAPTLTGISPTGGTRLQTLDVVLTGTNFIPGVTTVNVGQGITVTSTVTDSSHMTATMTIGSTAPTGDMGISVTNAGDDGGTSVSHPFTITNPAPTLAGIAPASGTRLQTLNVIFTGTNFINGVTTVNAGPGVTVNSVTVNSSTKITASVTVEETAAVGRIDFSVANPAPGGGTSVAQAFTVTGNPVPSLSGISPASGTISQAITVTLTGQGFMAGVSGVQVNGPAVTLNSFAVISDTQITATITTGTAVGSATLAVTNAGPGGGTSGTKTFTVNYPTPTITSFSPGSAAKNQTVDVLFTGTNFISGVSAVTSGSGAVVNSTTVISGTQLIASITTLNYTGPDPVSADLQVRNGSQSSGKVTLTVNTKTTPTITWSNPADILAGTALSGVQLNATASVPGTFTYTPAAGTILNGGSGQSLRVDFTPTSTSYNSTYKVVTINVRNIFPAQITLSNLNHTYDGSPKLATVASNPSGIAMTTTYKDASGNVVAIPTNAGSYTVHAESADSNYTGSADGALTIEPAPLTVTVGSATREYGEANPTFTGTISGLKNGDNITVSYASTATAASAVGSYAITAAITDPAGKLGNYTPTLNEGTLAITKAALLVTPADAVREYGDANPTFTGSISGLKNGDSISAAYATEAGAASPVGTYAISAALSDEAGRLGNYNLTLNQGRLTITKAALLVTPVDAVREYGDANPAFTGSISGLKNGDSISAAYATEAGAASPVGIYPITATVTDAAGRIGNYDLTLKNGTLTIRKAPLNIKANDATRIYGDVNPLLHGVVTGTKNSDAISAVFTTAATATSAAGTYAIVPAINVDSPALANYEVSLANGTLTITKAPLTVIADNASREYGAPNPNFTATFTGFRNGESQVTAGISGLASCTSAASTASPVGSSPYDITCTAGTLAATNYDFIFFIGGKLVITKAPATITLADLVQTYDGAAKSPTATTSPAAIGGIILTFNGSPVPPVNAGSYTVVASLVHENYMAPNITATLVVNKASQAINWSTPSDIIYGTALGSAQLNATVSAVGRTPTGQLSYTPAAGTQLGIGSNLLTVTAAETENYLAATKTVSLKVIYGFKGLLTPYDSIKAYKINSSIPLKWQFTNASGTPINSVSAHQPVVEIFRAYDAANDLASNAILIEDSGKSGYQYDNITSTWQYNWKTAGLASGTYYIRITNPDSDQRSTVYQAVLVK